MPPRTGPNGAPLLTAHPHQLGVQEWATYALVVDTRRRVQYGKDHIPGAVCVPVQSPSSLQGSKEHAASSKSGVRSSPSTQAPVPASLIDAAAGIPSGSSVLLYGDGGEDALATPATWLRERGLVVDVLAGGWASYRAWVDASLELLPRLFAFRVLAAPPAGGIEQVIEALCELGEQAIDIGAHVRACRWPGASHPTRPAMSQAAFETWLLNTLRHRETHAVVWVAGALDLAPTLRLPAAMREAVARAPVTVLRVPPAVRARAWVKRLSPSAASRRSSDEVSWPGAGQMARAALAEAIDQLARGDSDLAVATLVAGCLNEHSPDALTCEHDSELLIDDLEEQSVNAQVERWLVHRDSRQSSP